MVGNPIVEDIESRGHHTSHKTQKKLHAGHERFWQSQFVNVGNY